MAGNYREFPKIVLEIDQSYRLPHHLCIRLIEEHANGEAKEIVRQVLAEPHHTLATVIRALEERYGQIPRTPLPDLVP